MLGKKSYELSNHLGKVLVTVSDTRIAVDNIGTISHHDAKVTSYSDYSPFGVQLDGRTGSCGQNDTTSQTPPSITEIYKNEFDSPPATASPYGGATTTLDANLSNTEWTSSTSSFTNYNGQTGKAIALSSASADTAYLTLTMDVASGFELDVSSYSFYHRGSATGYTNYLLTINGVAAGSGSIWITSGSTLQSTGNVSVSNAISGQTGTVSVVLKLFGGTHGSSGTFRMDDFVLNGYTRSVGSGGGSGSLAGGRYRYGFNSMEKDDEAKGAGNSYDFGARMYDSRVGRFLSRDPRSREYNSFSPYCYAVNNPIKFIDYNGEGPGDPVRLYIASVNNQNSTHSETFFAGAKDIQQENGRKYGWSGIRKIRKAYSGTDIINHINGQEENSIKSIDLFSHSSTTGIWFYHNTDNEIMVKKLNSLGFGDMNVQQDDEYNGLYQNFENYQNEPGIDKNAYQSTKARTFSSIDISKFTNDARVEFHGCETAGSAGDEKKLNNNICIDFSKMLYEGGKKGAVVIGHIGQSGPANGTNDYRNGVRYVYWNGNVVLKTKQEGEIDQKDIDKAIENFSSTSQATDKTL